MGDPKLPKKKYRTPNHPWQKGRIEEELVLMKEYGLKNKKEIWKMVSLMRSFHEKAKRLIVSATPQAQKERTQMMRKLSSYGVVEEVAPLDDVLGLTVRNFMDRRLQTLMVRQGLARTVKQARHFIVHRHVMVGENIVTAPSYLVTKEEGALVRFTPSSALASPDHPVRAPPASVAVPAIPEAAGGKEAVSDPEGAGEQP